MFFIATYVAKVCKNIVLHVTTYFFIFTYVAEMCKNTVLHIATYVVDIYTCSYVM